MGLLGWQMSGQPHLPVQTKQIVMPPGEKNWITIYILSILGSQSWQDFIFHFFIIIGILSMPQIMVSLNFYPKLNEELVIHKAFLFTELASEYFYCIIIPICIMAKKRKIRNFLWNEFWQSYWNLKIKSIYFFFL